MSTVQLPDPVKVIASIFSSEENMLTVAIKKLSDELGEIDYVSELLPFDYTDYYRDEMGTKLLRRFVSFDRLRDPGALPHVKVCTNRIEADLAREGKRRVNIDPGYISEAHLILATGKKYTHRPYIGDGIYADVTLIYRDRAFQPLEWTYPDYAGDVIIDMLIRMRKRYIMQLAESRTPERRRQ